jgi:thioesterase domain-containing protein
MVPSFVVAVERLPLTVSGKLDFAQLPAPNAPRQALGTRRPRNITKETLCGLWQDVLGVGEIDIETGFFEACGTSLLAVRLASEIREMFGTELPLPVLFNHPTLAALASLLKPDAATAIWSAELASAPTLLAGGGAGPPSFWFPGLAGHAMGLGPLAARLTEAGPVHALLLRGVDGRSPPDGSLTVALARQVEAVRRVQPEGPYRLGGHSLGGKLAWMVAELLIREGEVVETLCMLVGVASDEPVVGADDAPEPALLLRWLVAELAGIESADLDVAQNEESYEAVRSCALAHLHDKGSMTITAADLDALVRGTVATHLLLSKPMAPPETPLPISTLFIAGSLPTGGAEPPIARFGRDLGWSRFVDTPECRTVEASHAGLLRSPQVDQVARFWHDFGSSKTSTRNT